MYSTTTLRVFTHVYPAKPVDLAATNVFVLPKPQFSRCKPPTDGTQYHVDGHISHFVFLPTIPGSCG